MNVQIRDVKSIMDQEKVTLKGALCDTQPVVTMASEEPFGVSARNRLLPSHQLRSSARI